MWDFVAAVGLVFVIEGLLFVAFPAHAKRAMESVVATPENSLRIIGIASAIFGLVILAIVRL
jgi:uncharacterized protein YjeT (DUF2065 family)